MIDRLAPRRMLARARLAVGRRRCRFLKYGGGTRCFDLSDEFDGVRAIMFEDGVESCVRLPAGARDVMVDKALIGDEFALATLIHAERFENEMGAPTGVIEIDSGEWPVTIGLRTSDEGLVCYTLESVTEHKRRYEASATSIVESGSLYIDPLRSPCTFREVPFTVAGVRYTKNGPRAMRYTRDAKFDARIRESDYGKWSEKICRPLI